MRCRSLLRSLAGAACGTPAARLAPPSSSAAVRQLQPLTPNQLCQGPSQLPRVSLLARHLARHLATSSSGSEDAANSPTSGSSSTSSSSARGRDLAIVFTCAKCDTRSAKAFSRQAYELGLVLITCPGCQSLHLISDHLGWFGDGGFQLESFMAARGQAVKRVDVARLQAAQQPSNSEAGAQLSVEDVAGYGKVQQLLQTLTAASAGSPEDEQQQQEHAGSCCGSSSAQQAERAAGAEDTGVGVVQLSPADVEAFLRVMQRAGAAQEQAGEPKH